MTRRRPVAPVTFAVVLVALAAVACTNTAPSRRPAPRLAADPATRDVQLAALRVREREGERLVRVGERVLFAGAPLCGTHVVKAAGFALWNAESAGSGRAPLMRAVFGLDDAVRVRAVGDGAPAAEAGLEVGDTLVAIDGKPVPAGPKAVRAAIAELHRLNQAGRPYTLTVRRDDGLKALTVAPRPRCDYAYRVAGSTEVNAWTNGSTVMVSRGMMRFAETDTELAVVFGHELAHNVRRHLTKSRINSVAASTGGTVVDIVLGSVGIPTFGVFATVGSAAGTRAYSKTWEREADRVGLYFAARAGYDVDKAQRLWRRLAVAYGGEGQFSSTHPSYAQRIADVTATAREIDAKKARGAPLMPDDAPPAR
jgi:Zn-dependent protease with chaperone function